MSVIAFMTNLAEQGVKVWADGEQLRYRAPKGVVTAPLLSKLMEYKAELLTILTDRQQNDLKAFPFATGLVPVVPAPAQAYQPFPTTDVQQAYWIGRSASFELGNVGNHCYVEVEAVALDLARSLLALRRLVKRHPMLRAVILPDGQQQILEQVPPFPVEFIDLQGLHQQDLQKQLQRIRSEMDHQVFQIEQWPALAIRVSRLHERRVRIHVSIEVLFADAWSMFILVREFQHLYHEPEASLPPLELTFRDYVLTEVQLRASELYQRSRDYWVSRLQNFPPPPDLPLTIDPASISQPHFVPRQARMEAAKWQRLKAHAAEAELTPSGILLAAFAEVLTVWSKTSRFCINLTLFHRLPLHEQVNEIVGDFSSVLLLTVDKSLSETFERRAKRIQEQLWSDFDHRSYSGIRVLRDLARQHREGASPLPTRAIMPVVFTSVLGQQASGGYPAPWQETLYFVAQTPQVWLDNQVMEEAGNLAVYWQAVEVLFPPGLLDTMFTAYTQLLERLASDDEIWARDSLSSELVPSWQLAQYALTNATEAAVSDSLLQSFFLEQVSRRPDHCAVISAGRALTYQEVFNGAALLGHQLRQLGARPNQLIAVVMEKGWEQVVGVLGVLLSGAAYLPIDPKLPQERVTWILEHGEVEVLVTQSWVNEQMAWPKDVRHICVDCLDLSEEDIPKLPSVQNPDDLAYVIYTSGSTGVPKGVMIDHRGAVNTLLDINERFAITSADRILALSALNFDLSVYDIFGILAAGGTIVLPPEESLRDPAIWIGLLARERITVWNTVPALLQMLVEYTEPTASIWKQTSLRLALLSGDWIPLSLPERIKECIPGIQVISLGGATEASIWSILYPIESVEPSWKSIPYGRPMRNQQFFVFNEQLAPCPVWAPGHLYIGGIGLARSYWRDEEKTQASFLRHPKTGERIYRTGDVGRYLPDGTIEFLGREDFQVKISGYRIELGEIETVLGQHPQVSTAVVVVQKGPSGMQRLVAYVVGVAGIEMSEQELRTYLQEKLPEYMVPRQFVALERLPLTPNGKVDRRALPSPEQRMTELSTVVTPSTPIEEMLVGIWSEVLECSQVGIHDNFFALGGQSLLAMRLIYRLQTVFRVDIPLFRQFEAFTIAEMARGIEDALRDQDYKSTGRDRTETGRGQAPSGPVRSQQPLRVSLDPTQRYRPFPTTDVQQAYWIGRRSSFELGNVGNHGYMEVEAVDLNLARSLLIVRQLIERHPMLRAVMLPDGQQQILEHVPLVQIEYIDLSGLKQQEIISQLEHIRSALDHQIFQAEQWPVWAIRVSRLHGQRIRIHFSMESLFVDAWSMRILLQEFLHLYREPAACLPPLELSFRDYVLAEAQLQDSELYQRSRTYWSERLQDLPPAPDLPLAIDPASVTQPRFVPRKARMEAAKWQRLKACGAQVQLTPSGILLAAFAEVLAIWSKTPRFCINLTLFNRLPLHKQVNEIVGDFTSLLLLAVDHSSPSSFEKRARRLQEQILRDFGHHYYSGVRVLRDLARMQGRRVQAIMPVVFTSLLVDNTAATTYPSPWSETIYAVAQTPQVWLDHQAQEESGNLVLYWHAVEALFPPGLLDAMFATYTQLLERLATDNEIWQKDSASCLPSELEPSLQLALYALKTLPLTPNGKVERQAWPDPEERMAELSTTAAPPTPIEETLIGIWGEVLGRSPATGLAPIGIHDNFFALGGQSLLAVRLIHRVKTVFQVEIPLTSLFEAGTVTAMARSVEDALRTENQEDDRRTSLPQVILAPDEQYLPFPTTDVQQAYWIGRDSIFELGNVSNHGYAEAEVVDLDLARALLTLRQLIKRHPMLRAVMLPDGQQQILEHVPPAQIEYIDLSGLSQQEMAAQLEHIRSVMDHQVFQVEQWPVWAIRISRLHEQRLRIHFSMESLFVDAWSMRILLREFLQLYHEPEACLPPLEISFRDYILTETQLQETELYRRSQDYWTAHSHNLPLAPDLPLAIDPASVSRPHFVPRQARMEAAKWQRLKAHGAQVELTSTGILLAAFAEVLTAWSKTPRFCINLTLFNRLPLHEQVNEIVGDFTSLLPVAIDNSPPDSFERRARRLEEQMWRDFEHRYYSGIQVLRDLARMHRERDLPARAIMPVVFTSLLGQAEASAYPPLWQGTYYVAQTPQVWLDHQVLEDGENLMLYWHAVEALFPPGLLDEMFAAYIQLLERLATDDEVWQSRSRELIPSEHVPHEKRTSYQTLSLRFGQTSIRKETGKPVIDLAPEEPHAGAVQSSGQGLDEGKSHPAMLRKYKERLSYRRFLPEPLSLRQLSDFLRPLRRIELEGLPKYLYPSAGSIYPVQTYLSVKSGCVEGLAEGVYYYNPELHQLTKLSESACVERSVHGAINQPIFDQAAFSLFLIGDLTSISLQYGDLARDFCLLEAGYMGQLLMMTAAEHHIGLCPVGGLDFGQIRDGFALGENHVLLHSFLCGHIDPDAATGWSFLPTEMEKVTGEAGYAAQINPSTDQVPPVTTRSHHLGYREPTSEIERTVATVWQEMLGHAKVGIYDNFFDLGGNSLIGVRVMNRLRKIFELDLSMHLLFIVPTVEGIAEVIRQEYVKLLGDEELAEVLNNVSQISEEEALLLLGKNFSDQEGER